MLEVVCYNLDAVKIAVDCGADRIELCSAPLEGGLTPSPGFVEAALKVCKEIPVHAMLRCREGNFIYNEAEKKIMLHDLEWLSKSRIRGIVCGALNPQGKLDVEFLSQIKSLSGKLNLVFHRAIDVCSNPLEALKQLMVLNFYGILTSGGAAKAADGTKLIQDLKNHSENKINIMAGSGINAENIKQILVETGVRQIHLSAINSSNTKGFNEGINSFHQQSPYHPDADELIKCIKIFKDYPF